MPEEIRSREAWLAGLEKRLGANHLGPLEFGQKALDQYPADGDLLLLAAFGALIEERPDICLRYLKRLKKRYLPLPGVYAGQAIALAQQGRWSMAQEIVTRQGLHPGLDWLLFPPGLGTRWGRKWLSDILKWKPAAGNGSQTRQRLAVSRPQVVKAKTGIAAAVQAPRVHPVESLSAEIKPLPLLRADIPISFALPDLSVYECLDEAEPGSPADSLLRLEFSRLALFRGFDDLFCLSQLQNVDRYWYQVETVRKVLKQFRGRVLLADEVGLGKTIEAGMILKEYLLRGMAERVLILTPAPLVGQWRQEMKTKFDLDFITTRDPLLRRNPAAFWRQPRIIASIATARHPTHFGEVAGQPVDLVVVDEAHHLKNRSSKNWKLVDALQKRFLLLLSATPVQNNLLELYNLLNLLKPGIFKTEREFRSRYVTPRNPRLPSNREHLQELMRDVMIRNTRALVDVRLPARHAATLTVAPSAQERECYLELSRLVRVLSRTGSGQRRALHHLLEAAGSSPAAAFSALHSILKQAPFPEGQDLHARYGRLPAGSKIEALFDLLERNPNEKKMVFVRFGATFRLLDRMLRCRGMSYAVYHGRMTGTEKDGAIEEFRTRASVLLCTESGGEGRNVQFCNTLINFDLPWNPQLIEQRIGRIHRIGQTREVFVFNLVTTNTVEEQILRILDEKINMFELVVGEIQCILGEMRDERDFGKRIFAAWLEETEEGRRNAFEQLSEDLAGAKRQYKRAKALDERLFGEEFEVA